MVILHDYGARSNYVPLCNHKDSKSDWWTRNEHISTNIHPEKKNKGSMGQLYPYSTRREKNIVANINVYGDRVILLLFCDHQDTKSE